MAQTKLEKEVAALATGMSEYMYGIAKLCIETQGEYDYIVSKFLDGMIPFEAVMTLRTHKLQNRVYDYKAFESDYNDKPSAALGKLFLHPIKTRHMVAVNKAMPDRVSLKELYDLHCSNPTKPLLRILPR